MKTALKDIDEIILAIVEQLMRGEDGIARAAVVRVLRKKSNNSQPLLDTVEIVFIEQYINVSYCLRFIFSFGIFC